MPLSPNLYCGPAGWSYAHWNGVVYPRTTPRLQRPLSLLARHFDAVEINRTFYQPIRPEVARLWLAEVAGNPRFQFTAKLSRRFTHDRMIDAGEASRFRAGLWPLLSGKRLGCVLMQFPWTFRFNAENREYLIRLRREFRDFPLVAEMRHSSWTMPEAIGTFIDYHIGFCNIDQTASPTSMPVTSQLTTRIGYVRLHGRARGATSPHLCLYREDELREWASRITKMAEIAAKLFVITNNDGAGRAVVNALQLAAMLGDDRRLAPPDLIRRYPLELQQFAADRPAQRALFTDSGRAAA